MIQCAQCTQYFHRDCISCLPKPLLFGDIFMEFTCSVCTKTEEKYIRHSMAWITVVQLVLYNLMRRQDPDTDYPKDRDHQYFRWKEDLCAFIDDYWEYLHPGKQSNVSLLLALPLRCEIHLINRDLLQNRLLGIIQLQVSYLPIAAYFYQVSRSFNSQVRK